MKLLIFSILLALPTVCTAQHFTLAGRMQIRVPASVTAQLYNYIEKQDGLSLANDRFAFVPVYNARSSAQQHFSDDIYFFTWGAHDSGRLFINRQGKIAILGNGSVAEILTDYSKFIKATNPPEAAQIAYLTTIASFMKYRHDDQRALIKSGTLLKVK